MGAWFEQWFDEDYERLYSHRDQGEAKVAVETALRLAPKLKSGPVLDLGCGSGRHLMELRAFNEMAFGLDLSEHLLSRTPPGLRPWLVRGDMRHLPIRESSLTGVLLWFTPFGYFSDQENWQLLHRLGCLVHTGGTLLLDYMNVEQVVKTLEPECLLEKNGLKAVVKKRITGSHVEKTITLSSGDRNASREVVERVRLYSPSELVRLCAEAGFRMTQVVGDYEGKAFHSETSTRWMALFQKVETGVLPSEAHEAGNGEIGGLQGSV